MGIAPGLDGYLAARQQQAQEQQAQIQMLGALTGLQSHMQEAQMFPLRMKELQGKIQEQERMDQIMRRYQGVSARTSQQPGALDALTAGANVGDIGPTVTNAARMPATTGIEGLTGGRANPLELPESVQIELLHPRLQALGKANAENYKPTDKMREMYSRGIQPNSPQWNAELGTHFSQQGAWQIGPDGQTRLAPGYAQGQGDIKSAEEAARAQYDLVPVPLPDGSTRMMPRSEAARALGGGRAPAPQQGYTVTPQQQTARDATRLQILEREAQSNPNDQALQQEIAAARGRQSQGAPFGVPSSSVVGGGLGRSQSPGDKQFAEKTGTNNAETYAEIAKSGFNAPGSISKYQRLGSLLEQVETGKMTPTTTNIKAWAKSAGIELGPEVDNLGPAQAAQALANQLALELRNPAGGAGMPGAMSDQDRNFLQNMVPNLGTDPKAVKLMIDYRVKLAQRDQEVAQLARDYKKRNGGRFDDGFYDELAAWSSKNPLFPQQGGKPGASQQSSGAQYKSAADAVADGKRAIAAGADPREVAKRLESMGVRNHGIRTGGGASGSF